MVALLHAAHGALTRILVGIAAEQVEQKPLAHRAVRHAHRLDAELLEDLRKNRHTTGERLPAIVGHRAELQVANVFQAAELMEDTLQAFRADVDHRGVELPDAVADRAHRARTAYCFIPATLAKRGLVRLDGLARRDTRPMHALLREPAIREELLADPHASGLQAFHLEWYESFADDDLGAAAANVADQAAAGTDRHGV